MPGPWDPEPVATAIEAGLGGGLRHSDDQVELPEQIVNLIRRHAPDAAIAFNSAPDTTFEAAARWID